jgi:glycosyltransferase involved in cell wall biosynthesis
MRRSVFFLKDSRIHEWLISGFAKRGFPVEFMGMSNPSDLLAMSRIRRIISLHSRYLRISLKSLFKSRRGDVIICFLDVMGLYVFLLSRILFRRREIIVINIMFNDGGDFLTSIKRMMFRMMLKNKRVYPTVTSSELSAIYKELFNIPEKHFYLLHDCYGKQDIYENRPEEGNYVFCGGTNGRDWHTLLKAAEQLPDIRFVVVGPQRNTLGDKIPGNIEYFFNIPYDDFQKMMLKCSILALPLNTVAPAGLIVLFSAGLMHKPLVSTNNYTLREYVTSGENGFLIEMRDYVTLAEKIKQLNQDSQLRLDFGDRLYRKVVELGSPDTFIDKVIEIVKQIRQGEAGLQSRYLK